VFYFVCGNRFVAYVLCLFVFGLVLV